jgi:multimeric flavodoxin WrbA
MPHILGIVGSPRRGGNTEILVDEVLRGASETGASTAKVILSDLQIRPCRACQRCWDVGRCFQSDDMPALLNTMQQSDVWVLGTPVYWSSPSAYFKLFLDRWFGQSRIVTFKERRVILAIPMGASDPNKAQQIEQTMLGMFRTITGHMEMNLFASIVASGVWDPGKIREYPEKLAAAYRAGQEVTHR